MESARVRIKKTGAYREPRIRWKFLTPFIFLSAGGAFVTEYYSTVAVNMSWLIPDVVSYNYLTVFLIQGLIYVLVGWLGTPLFRLSLSARRWMHLVFTMSLIVSGLFVFLSGYSLEFAGVFIWWLIWPIFQFSVLWALASGSSLRLMSYAVGTTLMVSYGFSGALLVFIDWVPSVPPKALVPAGTIFCAFWGFKILYYDSSEVAESTAGRDSKFVAIYKSAFAITLLMGVLTGILWGYSEVVMPTIFRNYSGRSVLTGISQLYAVILCLCALFAWPAGRLLRFRDSDAAFIVALVLALVVLIILSSNADNSLVASFCAAFFLPLYSITWVSSATSAVKRMHLYGLPSGWKVGGMLWGGLMLGRAAIVFFL